MSLDQQFGEGTLHILREAVLAQVAAAGMLDDRASEVMLAVHELAANAVRYGGGTGRVQMQATDEELICRVSDPGPASRNGHVPGSTPGTQHPRGTAAWTQPWPYEPGHGLWLVRQIADHISVASGPDGSQVTVVFSRVLGDNASGRDSAGYPLPVMRSNSALTIP